VAAPSRNPAAVDPVTGEGNVDVESEGSKDRLQLVHFSPHMLCRRFAFHYKLSDTTPVPASIRLDVEAHAPSP
jgi:hypothetical protein